ncbi:hypothetical protein MLD38_040928 [Melastoma candidum]|nr:hypothetical protein MLD38_040928 [Melastoma candidum]
MHNNITQLLPGIPGFTQIIIFPLISCPHRVGLPSFFPDPGWEKKGPFFAGQKRHKGKGATERTLEIPPQILSPETKNGLPQFEEKANQVTFPRKRGEKEEKFESFDFL